MTQRHLAHQAHQYRGGFLVGPASRVLRRLCRGGTWCASEEAQRPWSGGVFRLQEDTSTWD